MRDKVLIALYAFLALTVTFAVSADAAQRRPQRTKKTIEQAVESNAAAVPGKVSVDEATLMRLANDLAELDVKITNLQRKVTSNAEAVGLFRRPKEEAPDPGNPNAPKTPDLSEPPPFQFENADPSDADSAGLKDWTPADWEAFISKIVGIITAIISLFSGGLAARMQARAKSG